MHPMALPMNRLFDSSAQKRLQVQSRPISYRKFRMQAFAFDSTSGNFSGFDLLSLLQLEVDPPHLAMFKTDETDSSKRRDCNIKSRIGCVALILWILINTKA
jgi:hypothetical protein